jgi:UV DNA damage endonuclease
MKLGYACINMTLDGNKKTKVTTNRSMIRKTFDQKGLAYASELALLNCKDLLTILKWNEKNNIKFFRLSSNIFPWASEYNIDDLPDIAEIKNCLKAAGDFAKFVDQRLTAHPGPFNKLCSPTESVVQNTIIDLEIHGKLFDMLGLPQTPYAKINIHVGAAYDDKAVAAKTFCKNFSRLSNSVRSRLTVENDDKQSLFSTKDLFDLVHKDIQIPIVFDFHHHTFCSGGQSEEEALRLAHSTWNGIQPVTHYSESLSVERNEPKIKPQAHSEYVLKKIKNYDMDFDIMIEAKAKELALLHYRKLHNE